MLIKKHIGTKFVVQLTVAITIIVFVVGVLIIRHQERKFTHLLELKVEQILKQLVVSLRNPLWEMNQTQMKDVILSYLSDHDILAIRLVDNLNRQMFFGKDPVTGEIVEFAGDNEQSVRYTELFTPQVPSLIEIEDEGHIVGTCEVIFSNQFITSQVREITIAAGLMLVVLLVVETLIILLLVRQNISMPLNTVVSVAKRVSQGEFNLHPLSIAKERRSQDEIGVLLQAFRDMMIYLEDMARMATSISHGDLRQTVQPLSNRDSLGHAFANMSKYLTELASAATQIAGGDLTQDVTPKTENDVLGNAFHTMGQQLRESQEALQNLNKDLEERVKERTHQLKMQTIELAKAKEASEAAQRIAEAANQAKSVFLANMSHELRSPLNAILGFSQLTARNPKLTSECRENLDIIQRSGEHLLTLINQVLDLSKIEAGRMELNETPFNLHHLLDELEDMFRPRAEEKHLRLQFERTPDVPQYVCADEVKLRQVLINLLSNAVKFTTEGEVTLRVNARSNGVVGCWGTGKESSKSTVPPLQPSTTPLLHFEISDTGPGIAPDEIERLFEAFAQTDTGKQLQEGTGLGLSISRKFVQLMGGDINIESDVGQGSRFTFDIRFGIAENADTSLQELDRWVIALEPGQPCYRILIVDDRQTNRQLLVKLLAPLGFEVREAENGQEALDIWEAWEPHVIWMDMRMPVMDGYEATKRIKATAKGQVTAIIALTASAFEEQRAGALSAGCDDFLHKPFREEEIFVMLHKHLGVRFVYEEEIQDAGRRKQGTGNREQGAGKTPLTPAAFSGLAPEILAQLEAAAEAGHMKTVNHLIEGIRADHPALAETLAELAYQFDYGKIVTLIHEANDKGLKG